MQLRSAMLYVKDLERMKKFYAEMLGAEPTTQNQTNAWAIFDTGGVRFTLHAIPASIAEMIKFECPPVPCRTSEVDLRSTSCGRRAGTA